MSVLLLCLRVDSCPSTHWIDLPELESIQMGEGAFYFKDDKASSLIMRSDDLNLNWLKQTYLNSLHSKQQWRAKSVAIRLLTLVTSLLRVFSPSFLLQLDMPNLSKVYLPYAFSSALYVRYSRKCSEYGVMTRYRSPSQSTTVSTEAQFECHS